MTKQFLIVPMMGGLPDIDALATPYAGFVFCDRIGDYGAYLFAGTDAQLDALIALPQVIEVARVGSKSDSKAGASLDAIGEPIDAELVKTDSAELEKPVEKAKHAKLEAWLADQRMPALDESKTYRATVDELYKRFNAHFDLSNFDIAE